MNNRERLMAALSGMPADRVPFAPRIDLWFNANAAKGTLPTDLRDARNAEEICHRMGWGIFKVILEFQGNGEEGILDRPLGIYRIPSQGFFTHLSPDVERVVRREGETLHIEYHTPKGKATAAFVYTEAMIRSGVTIPWISEHVIKTEADYGPVSYIFENLIVEPCPDGYTHWAEPLGEDGLAAVYALTAGSPLHHVLKVLCDTTQFYFHHRDHAALMARFEESIGVYFRKVFAAVAKTPAMAVMVGANFDDTITYPPFFRDHILPWLREAADLLHRNGKLMVCHTDGENRGLMNYLADSGMDVADSVCPAPMTKVPIAEYCRCWGEKISIVGGVPSTLLLPESTSESDFDDYVDRLFEVIAPSTRFVVGVADAVPPAAAFHRLLKLSDRIEEEAALPLKAGGYRPFPPPFPTPAPSSSEGTAVPAVVPSSDFDAIHGALLSGSERELTKTLSELLARGVSAQDLLSRGLLAGMEMIGQRFANGDLFVPEVLLAARAMNAALPLLEPHLRHEEGRLKIRFLIGTVKGDFHDIGKNIVISMLKGVGFEIRDLGINVGAEKFVEAAMAFKPHIIGLSALLTTTMPEMAVVIGALNRAGIHNGAKILVGGAPVNAAFALSIGADAYAKDAGDAISVSRQLMGQAKEKP